MRPHTHTRQTSERRFKDALQKMMSADHDRLEALLKAFGEQATQGDGFDLREEWRAFEDAVLSHLDTEEQHILPEFAKENPAAAAALMSQHERIRALATELGVGCDLHCIRAEQIQAFVDVLRAHARHEEAVLYPWAARQLGDSARRRLRRSLLARRDAITAANQQRFHIDLKTSSLRFSLRHIVVQEIRGQFTRWGGTIVLDPVDLTRSSVQVWIDLASIETGEPERDNHLRSSEFFDLKRFGQATFASTQVQTSPGALPIVRGRLHLHGVREEIELEVSEQKRWTDGDGAERVEYTARAHLNRRKFGLRWNQDLDVGGVVVGDQIEIVARVEAVRAKPR